ncbi:lytic transglycosylase domain-containing protein [Gymnodinialimonas sp. 2305UL16-5]|uniref:lytic transglycosylase domain-containing protein n=1 Tax=Gymnodinialimonas mytili TaxID=3126503 RepID=UPI0030A30AF7
MTRVAHMSCLSLVAGVIATSGAPLHADVLATGGSGLAPYAHSTSLLLFSEPEPDVVTASDARLRRAEPSEYVMAAINVVAREYADHPVLEEVGLTSSEWADLFQSNIEVESAYDPDARSPVGAIGLGQLMPATADDLGVDPFDMIENLDGSARYVLQMLNRFGSVELALAAYNAGQDAVEAHGGVPPFPETENHIRRVLAVFADLRS